MVDIHHAAITRDPKINWMCNPVFLYRVTHPVYLWVSSDCGVVNVHHDHLKVLIGGVLAHPVRVQDSQALEPSSNSFLSNGLKVPLWLLLLHSSRSFRFSVRTSFGNWTLASTTAHGDAIHTKPLLGFVPKSPGLVRPGWPGCPVDLV